LWYTSTPELEGLKPLNLLKLRHFDKLSATLRNSLTPSELVLSGVEAAEGLMEKYRKSASLIQAP